ncbi:MAG TPA: DUF1579 family protein [Planctomycetota bacterium]|nr:DUF1579 family protein [Planctomycetota bacterium]
MTFRNIATFVLAALPAVFVLTRPDAATETTTTQDSSQDPAKMQEQMKEMMAKAAKFTQPGAEHKKLARMVGTWTMSTRFVMAGQKSKPETGESQISWLDEGRWLQMRWSGSMMGQPARGWTWLGYDKFKMSYVSTSVSSGDTAMNRSEGDLTPDGKALVLYGTLDEYLTGEHDKMVRYVYRFVSDDEMVLEVHDLPIGLENTMVMEISFERKA